MKWVILETDIYSDIPEDKSERCYLNHSTLNSMSFGSLDMAWKGNTRLEAEGMASRFTQKTFRHHMIIEEPFE